MATATTMFPDVGILPGYRRRRIHETEIEDSFGLAQKDAQLPVGGLRAFSFNTTPLPLASATAIHDFLNLQQGSFGTFYFSTPDSRAHNPFAVGNVAGATTTYILPFLYIGATFGTVKVDGVTKTLGVDYNVNNGGAPYLYRALLEFTGVQTPDLSPITIVVTGREVVIVRQDSDTEDESILDTSEMHRSAAIALIEEL